MTDASPFPQVQGRCPACGDESLYVGEGGYLKCGRLKCPRPDLASEVIGEIATARLHGAFTFCDQLIGHATMHAFATKISEKVTAVAQRQEAVRYANEQLQRAHRAEVTVNRVQALARSNQTEGENGRLTDADTLWPSEVIAALDQPSEQPAAHEYLSTGCLHGQHDYCSNVDGIAGLKKPARCKFCAAPCQCPCHNEPTEPTS